MFWSYYHDGSCSPIFCFRRIQHEYLITEITRTNIDNPGYSAIHQYRHIFHAKKPTVRGIYHATMTMCNLQPVKGRPLNHHTFMVPINYPVHTTVSNMMDFECRGQLPRKICRNRHSFPCRSLATNSCVGGWRDMSCKLQEQIHQLTS